MSKFFRSVNEVESHKKPRQSDSALEKFCIPQCGWRKLCKTVAVIDDAGSTKSGINYLSK